MPSPSTSCVPGVKTVAGHSLNCSRIDNRHRVGGRRQSAGLSRAVVPTQRVNSLIRYRKILKKWSGGRDVANSNELLPDRRWRPIAHIAGIAIGDSAAENS